jgi:integrase/recombinase XerD
MKTSSIMESSLRDFLGQRTFRNPTTVRVYRCILKGFQRFLAEHWQDESISRETIGLWLCDRAQVWPFHLVAHRTLLVNRFLDWMVKRGLLDSNPFADLRKGYGQRSTTAYVRALLNPDPDAALNALRAVPRFGSFLGPAMLEHITLMKALGYRYNKAERNMLRLDRFLQSRPDLARQPLTVVIREWTYARSTPQHAYQCHETGRTLSRALKRIDPTAELIPWDKRIHRAARKGYRQPYVFSEQEIHSIFEAVQSFPSPRCPLRPQTLYTMLVLAYCCGLRIGEIVRLNVGDVDLENQVIEIRETKFFKSRRLPLSNSAAAALRSYAVARRKAGAPSESSSGLFWHEQPPGRHSIVVAGQMLARVLRRAGIKPERGRVGPRVHDLRHAFVCHRMLTWYREGINPQSRLPFLATYLGHKDIKSTLVYLTITAELMQHANERFRQYGAFTLAAEMGGFQ